VVTTSRLAADDVGQGPGGDLGAEDGDRPDRIEEGKLLDGQAVIEEQDGEDRIVEAGIEQDPEQDEQPDVGDGKRGR